MPPGRLEVRRQVASGDVVTNERTDFITLNGKPVTLPIFGVFEMQGGRDPGLAGVLRPHAGQGRL